MRSHGRTGRVHRWSEEVFATKVENGILGSFSFDRRGDIDPAPVGVYRYEGGKLVLDGVVRSRLDLWADSAGAPLGPCTLPA